VNVVANQAPGIVSYRRLKGAVMPRRSTALTRYIRETAMNVSRNVQDLFGTTEAAVISQLDPTPNREGAHSGGQPFAEGDRSGRNKRLPARERRGRD
jgi:hypothetical protein